MRAVFLTVGGGDVLEGALRGWSANGGGPVERVHLDDLHDLPEADVVCFPELGTVEDAQFRLDVQRQVVRACKRSGSIAVLDSPPGLSPAEVLDWRTSVQMIDSPHAVLCYPWILAGDGWIPPCGHIAGAWARVTRDQGVTASTGGIELIDVVDVATEITPAEQLLLHQAGVTVLRAMPGWGIRIAGARTLSSEPWLFRVSTVRLLAVLKPEVTRLCGAYENEQVLEVAIVEKIRSLTGKAGDAVSVRCEEPRPGHRRVRIDLDERVTAGFPLTLVLERWSGTWSVAGREPVREGQQEGR